MDLAHEPQIIDELFRKVRSEEILEDLKELGVDVREHTLKNPSSEEALGLYGLAIQVVFGKTRAEIRPEDVYSQIHLYSSGVEGLEITSDNLDFLKRGIGNLRFWRFCQKLHETLGLHEIRRCELFSPTQESFHRFTSAFVVYLRFREALKSLCDDLLARLNFCAEQEAQLENNLRQVEQEFQNFKRLKADNEYELDASSNDREHLENLLLQAKNAFNNHREEKAKLDADIEHVKLAINDVQLSKTKARHLYENLNEQVVLDIDSLYTQRDEMETQDAALATTLKNMEDTLKLVKERYERLGAAQTFLGDVRDKLKVHLEQVLKPLVENISAGRTLKARNATLREQLAAQKAKRDEVRNNLAIARQDHEQKLRAAQEKADEKLRAARQFADETHEQTQQIRQNISQANRKVESLVHEVARRDETIAALFRALEGKLATVTSAAEAYSADMNALVKQLHATLAEN